MDQSLLPLREKVRMRGNRITPSPLSSPVEGEEVRNNDETIAMFNIQGDQFTTPP